MISRFTYLKNDMSYKRPIIDENLSYQTKALKLASFDILAIFLLFW